MDTTHAGHHSEINSYSHQHGRPQGQTHMLKAKKIPTPIEIKTLSLSSSKKRQV